MLGGATYKFIGEEDTSFFSCLDKCTYMKEGEANSKYCFAAGNDGENKCMDSEATTPSAAGTSQGAGGASPSAAAPAGASPSSGAPAGAPPSTAAPAGATTAAAAPTGGKSGQL